ncbi:MAG: sel1 repeat family protein [Alphaproteobacteria bacterium]|nr:MAG: sel1 repeat family protein [Alphaproteobacteria bacterium]
MKNLFKYGVVAAIMLGPVSASAQEDFSDYVARAADAKVQEMETQAEGGDPAAQVSYGDFILNRMSFESEEVRARKARQWFLRAADQAYVPAYFAMAELAASGTLKPADDKEIFFWIYKAADTGDAEAQYVLAGHLFEGIGAPVNEVAALAYLEKSAALGYIEAQRTLGSAYYLGQFVEEDWAKSFDYYLAAAKQNDAHSQFMVGQFYYYGDIIPKDPVKADEWIRKSAAQNFEPALKFLNDQ